MKLYGIEAARKISAVFMLTVACILVTFFGFPVEPPANAAGPVEPPLTMTDLIVDTQQSILQTTLNSSSTDPVRIGILQTPELGVPVDAIGPGGEPMIWVPALYSQELISSTNPQDFPDADWATIDSHSVTAFHAIGLLSGPEGEVTVAGIYHTAIDETDTVIHNFVPIVELPMTTGVLLLDAHARLEGFVGAAQATGNNPCQISCYDTYRAREAAALQEFQKCMAANAPPFGICSALCIVACIPALSGTPLLYGACLTACFAGCGGVSAIDVSRCNSKLESQIETAEESYCACLAWKERNCPPAQHELPNPNVNCD